MEQGYCVKIGATGCYFLAIIKAAELLTGKSVDIVRTYVKAIELGFINEDCYVFNPNGFLNYLTGDKYSLEKKDLSYKPEKDDIVIGYYERKTTMKTYGHFVLLNSDCQLVYDSFGKSLTVQNGKLMSYRIFKKL